MFEEVKIPPINHVR